MIRYYHIRHKDAAGVVQAKGGCTIAYDTDKAYAGLAICSLKDNYRKMKGRKIAESRTFGTKHVSDTCESVHLFEGRPLTLWTPSLDSHNPQAVWVAKETAKVLGLDIPPGRADADHMIMFRKECGTCKHYLQDPPGDHISGGIIGECYCPLPFWVQKPSADIDRGRRPEEGRECDTFEGNPEDPDQVV